MVSSSNNPEPGLVRDLALQVAEICQSCAPGAGLDALLDALRTRIPDWSFRHAMTRGGWHRLGGILDLDGNRIADHVTAWAESESGGDMERLMSKVADLRAFVTRLDGRTHYLVAATGPAAGDFVQLEVEQLQEVLDRCIGDPAWFPDSIAEFVDPLDFPRLAPEPVGPPRLVFRRLLRVPELVASLESAATLARFLADWDQSSASESDHFCHHWVLALRDYRDSDGEERVIAKPMALFDGPLPALPEAEVGRGARLANQIHGFDRQLGYHFAWYFHMLTSPRVSHHLAEAVHADLMGAYAYLPARDLKVLRNWSRDPYGF